MYNSSSISGLGILLTGGKNFGVGVAIMLTIDKVYGAGTRCFTASSRRSPNQYEITEINEVRL